MSWAEIKKAINSDTSKSLDVLIKEQFNNNNSNVNNIKNDINYIKNTQLGTNLNNLLNSNTANLENIPLVDKINFLLSATVQKVYVDSPRNLITRGTAGIYSSSAFRFTPLYDGVIYVTASYRVNVYNGDSSITGFDSGNIYIKKSKELSFISTGNTSADIKIYGSTIYSIN